MTDEIAGTVAPPVETEAAPSAAEVETEAPETSAETAEETAPETTGEQAQPETESETDQDQQPKEEELGEFRGSAGARIRDLYKQAPGLQQLLDKFPKVRDAIAFLARRDAGLRDLNMSIAEAKEIRDRLPNGLQDLNTIEQDLAELGNIDAAFYNGRPVDLINHMHSADPRAAVELFKALPKEWHRLDPESYSEALGQIMSATFASDRIFARTRTLYDKLKAAGENELAEEVAAVHNYLTSFGRRQGDDSPQAKRLRDERTAFERQKAEDAERSYQRFRDSFHRESIKFQKDLIQNSPAFKRLPPTISQAKRDRMAEQIRLAIVKHLSRSRAFMAEMNPAFDSRDLQKALEIQRGPKGWQPWIVNMYVRRVLAEETPGIIEGNNAANARKRAAAARGAIGTRQTQSGTPTPASRGERKNPNDYTVEEIMSGKAPDSVIDEWIRKNRPDAANFLGR